MPRQAYSPWLFLHNVHVLLAKGNCPPPTFHNAPAAIQASRDLLTALGIELDEEEP
jgi:hypothetical protein